MPESLIHQIVLILLVLSPLLSAGLLALFPKNFTRDSKAVAIFLSFIPLVLGIYAFWTFNSQIPWNARFYWLSTAGETNALLNTTFHLRLDSVNILLVLLTCILSSLVLIGSWSAIKDRSKEFCITIFAIEAGMLGTFLAYDIFVFYLFFEIMLIPTLILIAMWGEARRFSAVLKFFVYTMFGSLIMLLAIIYIYTVVGSASLDDIYKASGKAELKQVQHLLFLAFALAFVIKVPLVPFHAWLPDTYRNAPIAGNVLLAGILAKAGTYGLLRFAIPIFPEAVADLANLFIILGVIGVIYGAAMAYAQTNIKQTIAYSSISHLGLIVLGLFAWVSVDGLAGSHLSSQALIGAMYQMLNHGLITGGLFLLLGYLHERSQSFAMSDFGGVAAKMPIFATIFMILMLASVGLPGTNGFIGEILIFVGLFEAKMWAGFLALLSVILGAVYMFKLYQRIFFGKPWSSVVQGLADINGREIAVLVPIILLCLIGGFMPDVFLSKIQTLDTVINNQIQAGIKASLASH